MFLNLSLNYLTENICDYKIVFENNNTFKLNLPPAIMTSNYYQLIERIAKASGKQSDDINRLVEAKRAKLSGLISTFSSNNSLYLLINPAKPKSVIPRLGISLSLFCLSLINVST